MDDLDARVLDSAIWCSSKLHAWQDAIVLLRAIPRGGSIESLLNPMVLVSSSVAALQKPRVCMAFTVSLKYGCCDRGLGVSLSPPLDEDLPVSLPNAITNREDGVSLLRSHVVLFSRTGPSPWHPLRSEESIVPVYICQGYPEVLDAAPGTDVKPWLVSNSSGDLMSLQKWRRLENS